MLASDVARAALADGIADTPLGVIDEADYSNFEVKMEPDDMVLCVSDAFTESVDQYGRMLGTNGLLSIVRQLNVPIRSRLSVS